MDSQQMSSTSMNNGLSDIQVIKDKLQDKIISIQLIEDCIHNHFTQIIQTLTNLKNKLLNNIKSKFSSYGLNENQKTIFNYLQLQTQLSSQNIKLMSQIINTQPQKQWTNYHTQFIKSLQNTFIQFNSKYIPSLQSQINIQISKLQNINHRLSSVNDKISFSAINQSATIKSSKYQQNKSYGFSNSKIITNIQEDKTIDQLFQPKTIKHVQLLYRASQNDFEAKKFHQLCDNIPNTLVLCQNQFNKKIGAFTPLIWQGSTYGDNQADKSRQSFIFSLTQKDKFKNLPNSCAIVDKLTYGPTFGVGHDLHISNKANQGQFSYANINVCFVNDKYKSNDYSPGEKFTGNPNYKTNFKVKEWQVWRIEFKKQE